MLLRGTAIGGFFCHMCNSSLGKYHWRTLVSPNASQNHVRFWWSRLWKWCMAFSTVGAYLPMEYAGDSRPFWTPSHSTISSICTFLNQIALGQNTQQISIWWTRQISYTCTLSLSSKLLPMKPLLSWGSKEKLLLIRVRAILFTS